MARPALDTSVFLAIADPTRRAMLEVLLKGDLQAGDFCRLFSASQSTLSGHLAVLRQAGLVRSRRDGRRQIYSVSAGDLQSVAEWVSLFDRFWTGRLRSLGEYLDRANPSESAPAVQFSTKPTTARSPAGKPGKRSGARPARKDNR